MGICLDQLKPLEGSLWGGKEGLLLEFVSASFCCVTDHPETQWLYTLPFVLLMTL